MRRVAAYCRVSTEADDQLNSLENQKRYFEEYIGRNLEWQFCGLYVDEGISGTSVEKRAGFKQMIKDAEARKFDLLLTKEISRFARNTLDSIFYTRKLKELGVGVIFMNDNINTLDADSELRLTIMSSIAQEESRKTSDRVRWGQKRRMEQGFVFGASIFGYHLKNGKLTINEDEAKIVRLIYDLYLSGMGMHLLYKELENRGIPAPMGGMRWSIPSVRSILRNEKYSGTLKQKKTITPDYLSHKSKINYGEEAYITVENNHAPIISKEIFDRVQTEIARRRTATLERSRYSSRYPFSGKIECAHCKSKFERRHNSQKPSHSQIIWRCSEAVKYGKEKNNAQGQKAGCNNKSVHEWFLKENFLAVLNSVIENKDLVVRELKVYVRQAIADSPDNGDEMGEITAGIEKIGLRKAKLIDTFVDGLISRAEFEEANLRYSKQAAVLSDRLRALKVGNETVETLQQKLANIETAIENLVRLKEFGDSICSEVLHKIVVEDREKISFYLKTGENADMFVKMPVLLNGYQALTPHQFQH
jgi:DNA invertase Pin-like site-specific DNA recombinase/ribosomal protein S25